MGEIVRLERPKQAMVFTGERFTSAESGQIEIEHVHRYLLARHFCRGKDVLDVASGEGYGAALLAQIARSVVGVDIADDAVAHAARNYVREGLSFRKGNGTELPVADASVDVVVSFETIEHLYDHERFLAEIRRILRPDGMLILSTPERDIYSPPDQPSNPHHVHELTRREYYALLCKHFPVTRFFGQRAMLGSAILADQPQPRADLPVVFEQRGEVQAEISYGLSRATYLICVACAVALPPLPESLFIYSGSIDKVFRAVRDLHGVLRRQREEVATLRDELQTQTARAEHERAVFKERELRFSAAQARLARTEQELHSVNAALEQAKSRLAEADRHRAGLNLALQDDEARLFEYEAQLSHYASRLSQSEREHESLRLLAARQLASLRASLREAETLLRALQLELADAQERVLVLHRTHAARVRRYKGQSLVQFVRSIPRERARIRRAVQAVQASPLFDPNWYLAQYDDVRERDLDPALHYVRFGAEEGRDPGPQFSSTYYVTTYPDTLATDCNPLEHYELFGRAEGRLTMPPPHTTRERLEQPAPSDKSARERGDDDHATEGAWAPAPARQAPERLSSTDESAADRWGDETESGGTQPEAILPSPAAQPQSRADGQSSPAPADHDVRTRCIARVVRASPLFDPAWYLAQYADVREAGMDPALHYAREGARQGRDPGPQFSTAFYVQTYPDVLWAEGNPLEHYELDGRVEGRETKPSALVKPTSAGLPRPNRAVAESAPAAPDRPRVVFISGEPHTPGHVYRVERYAEATRAAGADVTVQTIPLAVEDPSAIEAAQLVVIWRAEWNAAVEQLIVSIRRSGAKILFDVDDLMFDPQFARIPVIDGIRSQGLTEEEVSGFYTRIQQTMQVADFCSATTNYLTGHVRRWRKPSFVLPNGFDQTTWHTARLAVRARQNRGSDGLLRLGYAGGSRTHQKDFAVIAGAVARLLAERAECRLVLFRRETLDCLDLDEFPELLPLSGRIEWRELVPVEELPRELARFDINLAPLEAGNPFCESKSELKFFEAALAGVASICSPTGCYSAAIRHGETGLLARDTTDWYEAIVQLLDNPDLRERMARAAYHDVLWSFGPERRTELMYSVLEQILHRGARAARAFQLDLARSNAPRAQLPELPTAEPIMHADAEGFAEVTVIVPLHNYEDFVVEALDSVREQTLPLLDLIVIDDCSTDRSLAVARDWIDRNLARFNRVLLLRNQRNVGLALTRNVGFGAAESRFVLQLDADNKLLPDCALRCLEAIKASGAAFAYPSLKQFGEAEKTFSDRPYDPALLAGGNYIDATALVRLSAWAAVGGYHHVRYGWEDYDLWCGFAERGLYGEHVPEVLALYRVHGGSMLHTVTDVDENKRRLVGMMRARHPWILDGAPGAMAAE